MDPNAERSWYGAPWASHWRKWIWHLLCKDMISQDTSWFENNANELMLTFPDEYAVFCAIERMKR